MGRWQSRGGRARAEQCVDTLERGMSIAMLATCVAEARDALEEAVRGSGALLPITIDSSGGHWEPLTQLMDQALDSKGRLSVPATLRGLLNAVDLSDHVLVVSDPCDVRAWARFLKLFQSERMRSTLRQAAPVLAVVARHGPHEFEGAPTFDDLGLVEPHEFAAYVNDIQRWGADLLAQTCLSVTVETACGDFSLADELARQPAEVALDPTNWLSAKKPQDKRQERWRGKLQADSVWLSRHDPAALRRRVWRGQMTVLLPFIEEVRSETIMRHRKWLRPGACDRETNELLSVEDYEWPELYRQFARSSAPRKLTDLASEMRLLRNSLAHCRPVFMHEFRAAISAHAAAR